MNDTIYTQAYINDAGSVTIEAEGQQIDVSVEEATKLASRLCAVFGWGIRPSQGSCIQNLGKANENCTKESPLGG